MPERLRVAVRGAVQGVGFRPFVYRLARELDLAGWVSNSLQGVAIEIEGPRPALEMWYARLWAERPALAAIHGAEVAWLDPVPYEGFEIRESRETGRATAVALPDIATCAECRAEIADPTNRRYRYPFTNCTHCGPRFSILHALPYDRARTSMRAFQMCPACQAEYGDPMSRRFHAQPNACAVCGPQLALWNPAGAVLATCDEALREFLAALRLGAIGAVKGLGGFHLMVDASNDRAVNELRRRKHREEKPFALMYPDLKAIAADCRVSPAEQRLLCAPEAPIVLLPRRPGRPSMPSPSVAPACPTLGVMLPSTPLHHLLLAEFAGPVVATSGNISDEPICTDEREALARLAGIADVFLVHDRPIVRHVDDSIVRVLLDRELVLRRARGYAPLPIPVRDEVPPLLAVGGHLKNTLAMSSGRGIVLSQHIGDLESEPATRAFGEVLASLETLYRVVPAAVATDLHPDYRSTKLAGQMGLPVVPVQHHHAHVLACMAENDLSGTVLGVAWDGTGYGSDGTIWGGEFLRVCRPPEAGADGGGGDFRRLAALRPFRLPGGDRAAREPRRSALGVLYAVLGDSVVHDPFVTEAFTDVERTPLVHALRHGVNAPITTSAGRLFDGIAAILGLCRRASYEGQAAMTLEWAVDETIMGAYPLSVTDRLDEMVAGAGRWDRPDVVLDWVPMIEAVVAEARAGVARGAIAARVHNTLAAGIGELAVRVGVERVVLSGGCFQNRVLAERAVGALRQAGLRPYWHQRVPPNDGGLALGQITAAIDAAATHGADPAWHLAAV